MVKVVQTALLTFFCFILVFLLYLHLHLHLHHHHHLLLLWFLPFWGNNEVRLACFHCVFFRHSFLLSLVYCFLLYCPMVVLFISIINYLNALTYAHTHTHNIPLGVADHVAVVPVTGYLGYPLLAFFDRHRHQYNTVFH